MSSPGGRHDGWVSLGWSSAILGGGLIAVSGLAGGVGLTLAGLAVALVGFVVAWNGLRSHRPRSRAVPPASEAGWLEEDLETYSDLAVPDVDSGAVPVGEARAPAWGVEALDGPTPVAAAPARMAEPAPVPAPPPLIPASSPAPSPVPILPAHLGAATASEIPPADASPPAPPEAAPPSGVARDRRFEMSPMLPFAPAVSRSGGMRMDSGSLAESLSAVEAPSLEHLAAEVERLRVEFDGSSSPLLVPGLSVLPSPGTGNLGGRVTRVPEPPPLSLGAGAPGICGSCGDSFRVGPSGHYRCWECGRALCLKCFWKTGPGPELHRCSGCLAGAQVTSISVSGGVLSAPRPPGARGPDELE